MFVNEMELKEFESVDRYAPQTDFDRLALTHRHANDAQLYYQIWHHCWSSNATRIAEANSTKINLVCRSDY